MNFFNWINIRLALMFVALLVLFSFASARNESRKIQKIDVKIIDNDTPFLLPEVVNKLLIEKNKGSKTLTKDDLDLRKLEKAINKQKFIQNADVFVTVDGVLKAVVKQKTPLARVISQTGSFYLDYEGNKMPLSNNYSARVPLVSGEINRVKKEKLSKVLVTINEDEFLKKNIIALNILSNGSIVMKNRNYDFEIDFGRTINIDRKFKNYKAFFQKAVTDTLLSDYKRINLKFIQQVVCLK